MTAEELCRKALSLRPEERVAFLDQACGGQPDLRAAVEALLAARSNPAPVPRRPVEPELTEASAPVRGPQQRGEHHPPSPAPMPASQVTADYRPDVAAGVCLAGRYTLVQKLGEGGMGEVWVAKQSEPIKRKVALKLIKPGMDSRAVLQRFEQERQALAMMEHPNIAKVLDAGMTPTGQPFFVMELVHGAPLTNFCDERKLTPKQRLELFVPICQAVQHAHQKGVVHRDLKPANILVTMVDTSPVPKVIDFGVAKATAGRLTDESLSTEFGAVVGTLEYMSPEQAGFSGEDIDTRADIYSLGVILYELLTGLRPIDTKRLRQAALNEMVRIIREEEPSKPSTRLSTEVSLPSLAALRQTEPRRLMTMLRGELDWIVLKCLEKQRDRRYETANALSRDVQRYLADEPVEARPPSATYRLRKFARRHKGQVLAASLVLLALVAGIVGTSVGMMRADRAAKAETVQRRLAEEQQRKAEASEAVAQRQRDRARDRERQAIDAVKRFRDVVEDNPELKHNPALEGLRAMLLKQPLSFFRSLRDDLRADSETRAESLDRIAGASGELAELTAEIGDLQDAITANREAQAIWQELSESEPNVENFRYELAMSRSLTGELLRRIGKLDEARAEFEQALTTCERLVQQFPAVNDYRRALASVHSGLANVLNESGELRQSLESHQTARTVWRQLQESDPDNDELRGLLAASHLDIGRLIADLGQTPEALTELEAARSMFQALLETESDDPALETSLAHTHLAIGFVCLRNGDGEKARAALEAARGIQEQLVKLYPADHYFQAELAQTLLNLGGQNYTQGNTVEALENLESARGILQKLVEGNPSVTAYRSYLGSVQDNLGLVLQDLGKLDEARAAHEAAAVIAQTHAETHPESPDAASNLGAVLHNTASIDIRCGELLQARDKLRQAIQWQTKALAVSPHNPVYRHFLRNHYQNLSSVGEKLKDQEIVAEVERGIDQLDASDPTLAALDARLEAISKGASPTDNDERLQLAMRADKTRHFALATRLLSEAFVSDPQLLDNWNGLRYRAACAAAQAAAGVGRDAPQPDDPARGKLREQARLWLEAEIATWTTLLETADEPVRAVVTQMLSGARQDRSFESVRDTTLLATLPEAERNGWQSLWAQVDGLLAEAAVKTDPGSRERGSSGAVSPTAAPPA